jgi:putative phage-type endonuclease
VKLHLVDCEQRSKEWFQARAGKVTSSQVANVLAKVKEGEAATRANYKAQLVGEILTGQSLDNDYMSPPMQWGEDQEPYARTAYEAANGLFVQQVGFILHPTIKNAGASPDGLVGNDGMVEIKCPKTATHFKYLIAGKVPAEHQKQMLWQLACAEREWNDFISYDPRLSAEYEYFTARLYRDEKRIKEMEAAVVVFNEEVAAMVEKLRSIRGQAVAVGVA